MAAATDFGIEADTSQVVLRGRCLDHYTPPDPSEFYDIRAAMRAAADAERRAIAARDDRRREAARIRRGGRP